MDRRLMPLWLCLIVLAGPASSQDLELHECLYEGSACSTSAGVLLDESCGERFYYFRSGITWPPLRYERPITISVETRWLDRLTLFPLYIAIVDFHSEPDSVSTGRIGPRRLSSAWSRSVWRHHRERRAARLDAAWNSAGRSIRDRGHVPAEPAWRQLSSQRRPFVHRRHRRRPH